MEKDSKIYIAGHTGLVGSALVRKFTSEGYNNLVYTPYPEYDLRNQQQTNDFFEREKPEYVIIAAAKVGGILANNTYRAEFIYDNIMIESNIIHAAYLNKVKKLIFLGSSCIYPKNCPQPMKEEYLLTGPLEPTNEPYAIAKIAGIKLCENYYRQYGCNFFSVMPTNLYGPNDNFNLETSHVLPAILRKMYIAKCLENDDWQSIQKDLDKYPIENINGKSFQKDILSILNKYGITISHRVTPSNTEINYIKKNSVVKTKCKSSVSSVHSVVKLTLWGTGNPRREFLHVDNLADAVVFLMDNYDAKDIGEFVNIGIGKDQTIRELAELIKNIVGFKGEIMWNESKPDGTPQKLLNVEKLHKLEWKNKIELDEGIKRDYDWYKK